MQDLFNIDAALTEDERAVRDSVRRFVDEQVLPIIGERYVAGGFPKELIAPMAELGVYGANLPEKYGCAGLNNVSYGLIMQELERGDSGVRSFRDRAGRARDVSDLRLWQRRAAHEVAAADGEGRGDRLLRPHRTRLRFESRGMITRAREQKDGSWILNGAKMWITNGSTRTSASVGEDEWRQRRKSIRGFIVPTDSKGFSAKDQKGKLSLRASDTSELVFRMSIFPPMRSCRTPADSKAR